MILFSMMIFSDNCELRKWIHKAQAHTLKVNKEYCLSIEQFQEHLKSWGEDIPPEIKVKEFMTGKKSYEVYLKHILSHWC